MNLNKLFLRWIAVFGMVMVFAVSGWGAGDGLSGKYYKKGSSSYADYPISGTPNLTRTDSTVYFDWGYGNPGIGQDDNYQASWTGYVYIPTAGTWRFYTDSDDGVKLSVNSTQLVNNWSDHAPAENSGTLTLSQGYYPITMEFYEHGGGAVAKLSWSGPGVSSKTMIPQNNLYTSISSFSISNASIVEGNSSSRMLNFTVTLSNSMNATVDYTTTAGTATAGSDYNTTSGTLTFTSGGATSQTISVPIYGDVEIEGDETFTLTLSNPTGGATIGTVSATGTIIDDDYFCENNGLATGFHIIDPDGGSSKNSFEIFCSADSPKKVLIALNNKNSSNNFIFNNNTLSSTNYYSEASTNSVQFNAIEINPITLKVITSGSLDPTNAGSYKVMGKGFSNINLLGTPFAINWDANTTISGCDTTKLTRKGYHGQAVKINALDYNNQARCQIDSMQLKLLDDYTYLTYEGSEVLEKTCKEMAEAVPTDVLDSASVKGHYWIKPNNNGRSHNSTSITAMDRPIVAYCWYQTDLDYVWTFYLAMDGKVTNTKSDLISKADTCSEKGLWPFVPNNEDTFERVRKFLYDNKSEWVNYTGTINEKIKTFVGSNQNYYLASERPSPIWPYGSFGVYHPGPGTSFSWGGEDFGETTKQTGPMSGSPMHNLSTITQDYVRKDNDTNGGASSIATRDYYSWGNYSDTDSSSGGNYTYADTMGAKGWISILGAQDLNKTNDWFISRTGAGDNFDSSDSDWPYYEPNGNYDAGAWLNYLFDDQGRVRHNDDLSAKYAYYDYMCMAEDNYDFTTRYGLVKGPFNVIEHSAVLSGTGYRDANLTTKIANKDMRFDVVLLRDDLSNLRTDANVSAGIFLDDTIIVDSNETPRDLHYFGEISDFNQTRFELTAPKWPSGVQTWTKASKRLFFTFKYCSINTLDWTDCWTLSGNSAVCSDPLHCKVANSNDFAVRPERLDFTLVKKLLRAGVDYNGTINAYDFNRTTGVNNTGKHNTVDYNVTNANGIYDFNTTYLNRNGVSSADMNGTVSFSTDIFNMVHGVSLKSGNNNVAGIMFDNVGKIQVKIIDKEWAKVDNNDTDQNCNENGTWICGDANLTFIPDHFDFNELKITNNNGNPGTYTYIADELKDMAGRLRVNVRALNKNNIVTTNFEKFPLWENPVSVIPVIDVNTTGTAKYYKPHALVTTINDINISFVDGNRTISWDDTNQSTYLRFNFDRNQTVAKNSFEVNGADEVNISISSYYTQEGDEENITGNRTGADGSSKFVYGRIIPRDIRVFGANKPFSANGWYEVYNTSEINSTSLAPSKNGSPWYINKLHVDPTFGDASVTFMQTATSSASTSPLFDTNTTVLGVKTYNETTGWPINSYKAHIDTVPWLWYGVNAAEYADPGVNIDGTADTIINTDDCINHPCFNINVVPDIGRAGSATSDELKDEKANKETKRGNGVTYDYTPAIQ